jgi:hypothetical protein
MASCSLVKNLPAIRRKVLPSTSVSKRKPRKQADKHRLFTALLLDRFITTILKIETILPSETLVNFNGVRCQKVTPLTSDFPDP